jgi:hypothetical protein
MTPGGSAGLGRLDWSRPVGQHPPLVEVTIIGNLADVKVGETAMTDVADGLAGDQCAVAVRWLRLGRPHAGRGAGRDPQAVGWSPDPR